MLNPLVSLPIEIEEIDILPSNYGFTDIFVENFLVLTQDDSMLNRLVGLPIEIEEIYILPSNCGFTESDVIAA